MVYLIFDDTGELLDAVDFSSNEELNKFKINNPNLVLENENDFDDLDEFFEDDYDDEIDE